VFGSYDFEDVAEFLAKYLPILFSQDKVGTRWW
jgi:hypothetical protein